MSHEIYIDPGVTSGTTGYAAPIEGSPEATPDYGNQFAAVMEASQQAAYAPPPNYSPQFAAAVAPQLARQEQGREDRASLRGVEAPDAWLNQVIAAMGNEPVVDDFAIADETRDRARAIANSAWEDPETHYESFRARERATATNAPITEFEPGGSTYRPPDVEWSGFEAPPPGADPAVYTGHQRVGGPVAGAIGAGFGVLGGAMEQANATVKSVVGRIAGLDPQYGDRYNSIAAQIAAQSGLSPDDWKVQANAARVLYDEIPAAFSIFGIDNKAILEAVLDPLNLVGGGFEGHLARGLAKGVGAAAGAARTTARTARTIFPEGSLSDLVLAESGMGRLDAGAGNVFDRLRGEVRTTVADLNRMVKEADTFTRSPVDGTGRSQGRYTTTTNASASTRGSMGLEGPGAELPMSMATGKTKTPAYQAFYDENVAPIAELRDRIKATADEIRALSTGDLAAFSKLDDPLDQMDWYAKNRPGVVPDEIIDAYAKPAEHVNMGDPEAVQAFRDDLVAKANAAIEQAQADEIAKNGMPVTDDYYPPIGEAGSARHAEKLNTLESQLAADLAEAKARRAGTFVPGEIKGTEQGVMPGTPRAQRGDLVLENQAVSDDAARSTRVEGEQQGLDLEARTRPRTANAGQGAAILPDSLAPTLDRLAKEYNVPMTGKPGTVEVRPRGLVPMNGQGGRAAVVAYDDQGRLAGVLSAQFDGPQVVAVREDMRRQGIATRLYDAAKAKGIDVTKNIGRGGRTQAGHDFTEAYRSRGAASSDRADILAKAQASARAQAGGAADPLASLPPSAPGMKRLYRVEPETLPPARSPEDEARWRKALGEEHYQRSVDERGRYFGDDPKALTEYGHGEPGNATYYVDVPEGVAAKSARLTGKGGAIEAGAPPFTEYVLPPDAVARKVRIGGAPAAASTPPPPKKGAAKTPEAKAAQTAGAERKLDEAAALLPPEFTDRIRQSLAVGGPTNVSPESIVARPQNAAVLKQALVDAGAKGTNINDQRALARRLLDREGAQRPISPEVNEPRPATPLTPREAAQTARQAGTDIEAGDLSMRIMRKVPRELAAKVRRRLREQSNITDTELLQSVPGLHKALTAIAKSEGATFSGKKAARTEKDALRKLMEQQRQINAYERSEHGLKGAAGADGGGGRKPPAPPSGSADARYPGGTPPRATLTDAERAAKREELRQFGLKHPARSDLGEHRPSGTLTQDRATHFRKDLIGAYKRNADVDPVEHLMKQGLTRGDAMVIANTWTKDRQTARSIGFSRKLLADGVPESRVAQSLVRVGFAKSADEATEIVTSALKTADPESELEQWINAIGFLKTSFSMLDISGAGRQARSYVFHFPTWLQEFGRSGKTLVGKGDFLERQIKLYEDLARDGWDEAGLHFRDMGSYLRGGDEAFPTGSDLAEKVRKNFGGAGRVWAKLSENSNMAYVSMLNGVSGEVALNWGRSMERFGTPLTPQAKRDLANVLNHGIGRLTAANDVKPSIGRTGWAALNFFFFSPQNRGARIAFLFKDFPEAVARVTALTPKAIAMSAKGAKGARHNPLLAAGVRPKDIETLQLALGYATSTAFLFAVMAQAVGIKKVDLDPGSTNYMRAELGEYGIAPAAATFLSDFVGISTQQYGDKAYIDLTNGISQDIRLIYRAFTGNYVNSKGVRSQLKWDQEYPGGKPPPFTMTKNALLLGYLMNAFSPGMSGAATGLGMKNDDLSDMLENPITGTLLPGIIGNLIQTSGIPYPGRTAAKTSKPSLGGGSIAPKAGATAKPTTTGAKTGTWRDDYKK